MREEKTFRVVVFRFETDASTNYTRYMITKNYMPFFPGNQWLELKSIRKTSTGKEYAKKLVAFLNWLDSRKVTYENATNHHVREFLHELVFGNLADEKVLSLQSSVGYSKNLSHKQGHNRKENVIVSTEKIRKTGGNNIPLVEQNADTICISGNIVDRQPQNGGNGLGCQENLAYTLTATDRHAVVELYQKTVGALCRGDEKGIGNQYVSQDKCIINASCSETHHLIRRLTPLECERLQGFPDGWTDIPGASDSARYKALGNSVAIPCVEFIMSRIAAAMRAA